MVFSFDDSKNRAPRATDEKLSEAVERMQKVARLTTGINVHIGVVDGRILPDVLMQHLLRLGSVTPNQIISIDQAKLLNALALLKDLPNKLTEDDSSKRAEKKLGLMEETRVLVEDVDDVMQWKEKDAFESELDELKKNGLDLKVIVDIHSKVQEWTGKLKEVKVAVLDANDKNTINRVNVYLDDLSKFSTELLTQLNNFATNKTTTWTYQKVQNAATALKSVRNSVAAATIIKKDDSIVRLGTNDNADFTNYVTKLQSLSSASAALKEVFADVDALRIVVVSRGFPDGISREFSGFANGYKDIETMFIDLEDKWMKEVVNGGKMSAALQPLKALLLHFEQANKDLGKIDENQQKMIQKFSEVVDDVQKLSLDPKQANLTLQSFLSCSRSFQPGGTPKVDETANLFKAADELDKLMMDNVKAKVDSFMGFLNTDEVKKWLEAVKQMSESSDDHAKLAATLQKLKQSEEVNGLGTALDKAQGIHLQKSDIDTIVQSIKTAAEAVSNETGKIQDFQSSLDKYPELFKCLGAIDKQQAQMTAGAVAALRKARTIEPKAVTDGEDIIKVVLSSGNGLKALGDSIGTMKGNSTKELDALRALPKLERTAEQMGTAVRGIGVMKAALDHKNLTNVIVQHSGVVKVQLASVTLNQEDVQVLNDFVQLNGTFVNMYQKLAEWKDQNISEGSTVLENFSPLFSSAQNISGVPGNLKKMATSVQKLTVQVADPNVQKQLIGVKTALDTLGSFELDFSAYAASFIGSKDLLAALDVFFANYRNPAVATSVPPTVAPVFVSPPHHAAKRENSKEGIEPGYVSIVLIGGSLLVGFVIIVIIWYNESEDSLSEDIKRHILSPLRPFWSTIMEIKQFSEFKPKPKSNANADAPMMFKEFYIELPADPSPPPSPSPPPPPPPPPPPAPKQELQLAQFQPPHEGPIVVWELSTDLKEVFYRVLHNEVRMMCHVYILLLQRKNIDPLDENYMVEDIHASGEQMWWYTNTMLRLADEECPALSTAGVVDDHRHEIRGDPTPMSEETRIRLVDYGNRFKDDFIRASVVTFPNGLRFYLTQAPLPNTVEKYYWLLKQTGVSNVMLLCDPYEIGYNHFPEYDEEAVKHFKGLTVTRTGHEGFQTEVFVNRLKIHFEGEEPFEVTQTQPVLWNQDFPPYNPDIIAQLLRKVNDRDTVVVCKDGVDRSGTFAFLEYYMQHVQHMNHINIEVALPRLLVQMRKMCPGAIRLPLSLACFLSCAMYYTIEGTESPNYFFIAFQVVYLDLPYLSKKRDIEWTREELRRATEEVLKRVKGCAKHLQETRDWLERVKAGLPVDIYPRFDHTNLEASLELDEFKRRVWEKLKSEYEEKTGVPLTLKDGKPEAAQKLSAKSAIDIAKLIRKEEAIQAQEDQEDEEALKLKKKGVFGWITGMFGQKSTSEEAGDPSKAKAKKQATQQKEKMSRKEYFAQKNNNRKGVTPSKNAQKDEEAAPLLGKEKEPNTKNPSTNAPNGKTASLLGNNGEKGPKGVFKPNTNSPKVATPSKNAQKGEEAAPLLGKKNGHEENFKPMANNRKVATPSKNAQKGAEAEPLLGNGTK